MPREELLNNLRLQKMEIILLRKTLEEREREALLNERELRKEMAVDQEDIREMYHQRNAQNLELMKSYHEKKVNI